MANIPKPSGTTAPKPKKLEARECQPGLAFIRHDIPKSWVAAIRRRQSRVVQSSPALILEELWRLLAVLARQAVHGVQHSVLTLTFAALARDVCVRFTCFPQSVDLDPCTSIRSIQLYDKVGYVLRTTL